MTRQLVIHFNQFPWPLASGIELAATLAESSTEARFVFAGHAVPERGLFLPVPRRLARLPGISLPEPQSMRLHNLSLVSLPTYQVGHARPLSLKGWRDFAESPGWDSLQSVTLDGLPAGKAAANYIVRREGTRQLDVERLIQRVRFLLFAYREAADLARNLIVTSGADQVHAYQGNWLNDRAVVDVAGSLGVPCATYGEVAPGEYWHWDRDPYLMRSWQALDVNGLWTHATASLDESARLELARYAIEKTSSPSRNMFSTRGQVAHFDGPRAPTVVFFTANSGDERFGLDQDWEPLWADQADFSLQLWRRLRDEGIQLVIRVHPNTLRKPKVEQLPWENIERRVARGELPGLTLIPASSPVDSYALASRSLASVTWGSNIAIELVARGIPTVNVAPAAFDSVKAVPVATKMEAVMSEVKKNDVSSSERERAAAWLWFMTSQWPKSFTHVEIGSNSEGGLVPSFNGHNLMPSALASRLSRPWSRARSFPHLAAYMGHRYGVEFDLTTPL